MYGDLVGLLGTGFTVVESVTFDFIGCQSAVDPMTGSLLEVGSSLAALSELLQMREGCFDRHGYSPRFEGL
jgi:hypothetical protein